MFQYISANQAASMLGVDVSTLRRWCAEGSGPQHLKPGRFKHLRFRPEDVLEWLERHTARPEVESQALTPEDIE